MDSEILVVECKGEASHNPPPLSFKAGQYEPWAVIFRDTSPRSDQNGGAVRLAIRENDGWKIWDGDFLNPRPTRHQAELSPPARSRLVAMFLAKRAAVNSPTPRHSGSVEGRKGRRL